MKALSFTILLVCATQLTFGQQDTTVTTSSTPKDTTYWKRGGFSSLTFSQVSLSNWAAGGDELISLNSNVGLFAIRTKGRGKWTNSANFAYGLIRQAGGDFEKSDDVINIITQYGYRIKREDSRWFFSGVLDFKTQFDDGFMREDDGSNTLISGFFAPAYLVYGLGVQYAPSPKLNFSYKPVTGKTTLVTIQELADQGAFGVEPEVVDENGVQITPGENVRYEFGSFFQASYKDDNFESRLDLFTNYVENFGQIDVNWINSLVFNITKAISTNIFLQAIYDRDIRFDADTNDDGIIEEGETEARLQLKSVVGVGLTYKFGDKQPKK